MTHWGVNAMRRANQPTTPLTMVLISATSNLVSPSIASMAARKLARLEASPSAPPPPLTPPPPAPVLVGVGYRAEEEEEEEEEEEVVTLF